MKLAILACAFLRFYAYDTQLSRFRVMLLVRCSAGAHSVRGRAVRPLGSAIARAVPQSKSGEVRLSISSRSNVCFGAGNSPK